MPYSPEEVKKQRRSERERLLRSRLKRYLDAVDDALVRGQRRLPIFSVRRPNAFARLFLTDECVLEPWLKTPAADPSRARDGIVRLTRAEADEMVANMVRSYEKVGWKVKSVSVERFDFLGTVETTSLVFKERQ